MTLEETVNRIVASAKNAREIITGLERANIRFEDTSDLHEYFNLEIPVQDGIIRIYKPYKQKQYVAQKMTRFKATYSGIPVFFG